MYHTVKSVLMCLSLYNKVYLFVSINVLHCKETCHVNRLQLLLSLDNNERAPAISLFPPAVCVAVGRPGGGHSEYCAKRSQ
jgi:hypothetical protein